MRSGGGAKSQQTVDHEVLNRATTKRSLFIAKEWGWASVRVGERHHLRGVPHSRRLSRETKKKNMNDLAGSRLDRKITSLLRKHFDSDRFLRR